MAATYLSVFFTILIQVDYIVTSASKDKVEWEEYCSHTCGGGIQRMKGNENETRMCNVFDCPGDVGCITTHYTFESLTDGRIYDTSNNANYGTIKGEVSLDDAGKFGKCLHLVKNTNVSLGSQAFHNRPSLAITIASWVKITSIDGSHEIFHTCNSDVPSGKGQYHFEVNDGRVRWFHRDHMQRTVFNVESEAVIAASTWTHIAATYRTTTRQAKIYIDGEPAELSNNSQIFKFGKDARVDGLSPDWACASIGDYKNERPLDGYIDDFFIFKCELMKLEINKLFQTGAFKRYEIPVP